MDKLVYERDFDHELGKQFIHCRENKCIEFQFADDLDIHEFKILCIRLAHALGYDSGNIHKIFGQAMDKEENRTLKTLVDWNNVLNNGGNNEKRVD